MNEKVKYCNTALLQVRYTANACVYLLLNHKLEVSNPSNIENEFSALTYCSDDF